MHGSWVTVFHSADVYVWHDIEAQINYIACTLWPHILRPSLDSKTAHNDDELLHTSCPFSNHKRTLAHFHGVAVDALVKTCTTPPSSTIYSLLVYISPIDSV